MKKTIIILLLAFACTTAGHAFRYRIEGNVGTPHFTGWLYIQNLSERDYPEVDSLWVEKGEVRPFEGKARQAFLALLHSKGHPMLQFPYLFVEEGTVRFRHAAITRRGAAFEGTPLNDEWARFSAQADSLGRMYDEGRISMTEGLQGLDRLAEPVVRSHCDDILGSLIVSHMEELGTERLVEYIKMLSPMQRSNHVIYDMSQSVLAIRQTSEGEKFRDFEVEYEGKTMRLSDYVGRGQYVLADFWASWCSPCRQEIPNLIEAYRKYKDKGLVVLGIAAWDKPENTLKAIADLGAPYPQILNSQKVATDLYGIKGIPHIILFGPDGTILARGLRGQQILSRLYDLYGE